MSVFDQYTTEARLVILFARQEAGLLGGDSLQAKHLLLGLLSTRIPSISLLGTPEAVSLLREAVIGTIEPREPVAQSVDMPLADDAAEILSCTEKLAQDHLHLMIRPIHILAALVTVRSSVRDILARHGIIQEKVMALLIEDGH